MLLKKENIIINNNNKNNIKKFIKYQWIDHKDKIE